MDLEIENELIDAADHKNIVTFFAKSIIFLAFYIMYFY